MPLISQAAILLDEIARVGSIRRTAERVNASPSAVNRQILNLEHELGAPLFERLPKGVRLTSAGEAVVKEVRREAVVKEVRRWRHDQSQLISLLSDLKGLRRGHIAMGLMECMATGVGPHVIAGLNAKHSKLTLEVIVGGTEQIVDHLLSGTLHVAAAFNMPFRTELKITHETLVQMGAVVRPGHPLTRHKSLQILDCINYPLIVPDGSFALRSRIDHAMKNLNLNRFATTTVNTIEFIKSSILNGEQVSFLSVLDVYREVQNGTLAFIPLNDKGLPQDQLAIAVPLRTKNSSLALETADMLKRAIEDILKRPLQSL